MCVELICDIYIEAFRSSLQATDTVYTATTNTGNPEFFY